MTKIPDNLAGRLVTPAGRARGWVEDYERGRYTRVVDTWLEQRPHVPLSTLGDHPRALEALGWSLVLTKNWDAYARFRAELRATPSGRFAARLLAVLDGWRALGEGRYDASLHGARRVAAQVAQEEESAHLLAHAAKLEGIALMRLGRYAAAEAAARRAVNLFELAGDALQTSQAWTNLGLVLNARGAIRPARDALRTALDLLEHCDAAEERRALAQENLALVETHLGNVDAAVRLYRSALRTFERLDLWSEQVTALNGLGHCARMRGDCEPARAFHAQALARVADPESRQAGLCHEFLGRLAVDQGSLEEADAHLATAYRIAAALAPDGDAMVEVCWNLADLRTAQQRLEEAEDFIVRAERLCARYDDRRELGCVQRARAALCDARGDLAAAERTFAQAVETLEQCGRQFEAAWTRLRWGRARAARGLDPQPVTEAARRRLAAIRADSPWCTELDRIAQASASRDPARQFGFVTRSPRLLRLFQRLEQLAASPFPILVEGESGTGKELVARAIHATLGGTQPFVAVNCAALPRDLFEGELFGSARGAFSGAVAERPGLLEAADGGILFLDEVGELPLELQAKLLRVLDDGRVRRLGDVRERRVQFKLVAATNRPLARAVHDRRFRADLFHRLAVHRLELPPLRERPEDLEPLVRYLVEREGLAERLTLTPALFKDLRRRAWPGNVRELRNHLITRAFEGEPTPEIEQGAGSPATPAEPAGSLRDQRVAHDRAVIAATLRRTGGNVAAAARSLGLHVTTLRRRMRRLGITPTRT